MPILPREIDLFPEQLLDPADPAMTPTPMPWWVVYTLPRREKELMRRLRQLGVAFYGPTIERRRRSPAGRTRTSFVPLFPGYVFLKGTDEDRVKALTTHCVSRCLIVADGERLASDLRQIRRLVESNAPLTPESRIEPGARVRIRGGPLVGVEGVVVRRRGGDRLLVAVEFLQRGASLMLNDFQVEAV